MTIDWHDLTEQCVALTQRLIQTPSMPQQEQAIAALVAAEMRRLGFDAVTIDGIGNVIGTVYGQDRTLPALVLNSHLDHVDPGDLSLWPTLPFAAVRADGRIIGRGASDIKGPLATQVTAVGGLLAAGERPRRDVVVCAVVQEETGGEGATFWAESADYPIALIVLAEPSSNDVALGHRGIQPVWVTFHGRSAHASAPEKGINPNYALARFLSRLESARHTLSAHPRLGRTTVTPTVVEVDTRSPNVSPAWTRVYLDFRTASDSCASLAAFIGELAEGAPVTLGNGLAGPDVPLPDDSTIVTGFDTDPADAAVQRAVAALADGMGRAPRLFNYAFATDGRHFVHLGAPIIGYAPGDEKEAHTAGESIAIAQMAEALRGYVALLRTF